MSVSLGPDSLDGIRRSLGQTKDLAHGPGRPDLRERAVELHGGGLSVAAIARETGLSERQVRRLLDREAAREPRRPARTKLAEILRLRRQGRSLTEIGRLVGYSRQAVRGAIEASARARPAG